MSRKTPLTLKSLPKDWYMSWVIDNNWLILESLRLQANWLEEINPFSIKYPYNLLFIKHLKIFPQIESKDTDFLKICLSFFYGQELLAFFHSVVNSPCFIQDWSIKSSGLEIDLLHSFNMQMLNMPWPWALLGSRFWINVVISSLVKVVVEMDLSVFLQILKESSLEVFILEKDSYFSKKTVKQFCLLFIVCCGIYSDKREEVYKESFCCLTTIILTGRFLH